MSACAGVQVGLKKNSIGVPEENIPLPLEYRLSPIPDHVLINMKKDRGRQSETRGDIGGNVLPEASKLAFETLLHPNST